MSAANIESDGADERGLRIGIDATSLGSGRGYGRFMRELLPPLLIEDDRNEYTLFLDEHTQAEVESLPITKKNSGKRRSRRVSAHGACHPQPTAYGVNHVEHAS